MTLEALHGEIEGELPQEAEFVALSYQAPGEPLPRRVLMPLDRFNLLFKQTEPEYVLQRAYANQRQEQAKTGRRGRRRTEREPRARVDYTTPQHAGEPHRGRITDLERDYVRENLEAVNARLREKNLREIDPTDPKMVERYGLRAEPIVETRGLVEDVEVVEEEPPRG